MQTKQGKALASLRQVRNFLDAHADKLGGVVTSGVRKELDEVTATLDGHSTTQDTSTASAVSATQTHRKLRTELIRDHIAPIAKIAAAKLPSAPEFVSLRMPKKRPSTERLRTAALSMAETASKHADVFIAAGLPADFAAQLVNAADAMVAPVDERQASKAALGGATEGVAKAITAGRKLVHAIDALVKAALKEDSVTLRDWNIAKRVQRVGTVATPVADTPTTPALPAANTTAVPASTT